MYDELVAWLRSWSELLAHCERYESCAECDKQYICATFTNERIITKAGEAADAIEELSKLNAEITKRELKLRMEKPRWIPVTERFPERFKSVLTVDKYGVITFNWIRGDEKNWSTGYHITHWMPLPEPPKEE